MPHADSAAGYETRLPSKAIEPVGTGASALSITLTKQGATEQVKTLSEDERRVKLRQFMAVCKETRVLSSSTAPILGWRAYAPVATFSSGCTSRSILPITFRIELSVGNYIKLRPVISEHDTQYIKKLELKQSHASPIKRAGHSSAEQLTKDPIIEVLVTKGTAAWRKMHAVDLYKAATTYVDAPGLRQGQGIITSYVKVHTFWYPHGRGYTGYPVYPLSIHVHSQNEYGTVVGKEYQYGLDSGKLHPVPIGSGKA